MNVADLIAIGTILIVALIGAGLGFGRFLSFLSRGIVGKVLSIVVCYFIFGIVLDWPIVKNLLTAFVEFMQSKDNFFCNILLNIRIDLIAFAVVLFFAVQLLKKIFTALVRWLFEIDFFAIRIVNKIFGVILAVLTLIIATLLIFQLLSFSGAGTIEKITSCLSGSAFGLDKLFIENPLLSIIESINLAK
ncbi:MAG: hypothetical protein J6U92_04410 [Clostridia bacterium]|nr:hypothetical protein [Clostridia bacterium]